MRVIIIGGGVAGLGAALTVRRAARDGADVSFVLLEKDGRLGGKIWTEIVPDADGGRYIVDGGSDSFLTDKPAVHRVARELGIDGELTGTLEENKRTYIVKGGRLVEMPDGIMMFAPTKLVPLATTSLYSWPAKLRMALDLVIRPKVRWAEGETAQQHDETLESFVVRRMGRECLDRLAEPLVGGVHASDPSQMSLAATFPHLLEMEQRYGSVIRGMLAQRKQQELMRKRYPPKPGERRAFFNTFRRGMQRLTDAMADAIGRDNILTGAPVIAIERGGDDHWRAILDDGRVLEGDAVIVATEAWAAERLVRPVDERIGSLLATIPCSSSATVSLGFASEDFPKDRHWFGILVPLIEQRPILAVTLSSSKWPDRAPEGRVLVRGFVGGPRNQHLLDELGDEDLVEVVRSELIALLGMREDVRPVVAKVYRWEGGMPQYTLGHLDRVDEIERGSEQLRGFALAGGAYRGVGIPNCIESGERAVWKVFRDLGVPYEERADEGRR